MDNKDTKSIVGGVESEGAFSSDISSVKGHTSPVVQAPGQNEEFKADTHNPSSSSSEEGFTTNLGSSSSSEVASSVVAALYSASAPEWLWSEVRPLDSSGVETENEEESFRLVQRIHPSELEIVRKISKGGQAKIFSAISSKHGRVVVKRYRDPNVNVADLQRQMEMVMKACKGTSMSGLCEVYGVSRDKKGKALLVMPHMQGDLRNLINSKRILSHSDKRDIMRRIATGLKNLHACGRIHKDVKASNILVNHSTSFTQHPPWYEYSRKDHGFYRRELRGQLTILESRVLPSNSTVEWVECYVGDYESVDGVVGTGFWRPPEVLKALKYGSPEDLELAYSPAVDVYGFGMVLYELLTGRMPFQGHSLDDYDLVISGHRPDIPDDVSPEMSDLLRCCWHQDPHKRPSWTEIEKHI
jgi:serine/threonine protein kinase